MKNRSMAVMALFAATLGWGASFFIVKKSTLEVGPWPFLFWRLALSSLLMALLAPSKVLQVSRLTMRRGAILGILLFGTIATQTVGLQLTTATRSGFLTALYVPLTPVFAWVLLRQKMNLRQIAIAFVAVSGLYIMTSRTPAQALVIKDWFRNANTGDLWTGLTANIAALHLVVTENFSRQEKDSLALGIWQVFGAFGCIFIVALMKCSEIRSHGVFLTSSLWNISLWSPFSLFGVLFAASIATCFGFITQVFAQKSIGALKAALVFALEAPFAGAFAYVFTGEVMTLQETIGATLVFLTSICPESWLKKTRSRKVL